MKIFFKKEICGKVDSRYLMSDYYLGEITRVIYDHYQFYFPSKGSIRFVDTVYKDAISCEDFKRFVKEGYIIILSES